MLWVILLLMLLLISLSLERGPLLSGGRGRDRGKDLSFAVASGREGSSTIVLLGCVIACEAACVCFELMVLHKDAVKYSSI